MLDTYCYYYCPFLYHKEYGKTILFVAYKYQHKVIIMLVIVSHKQNILAIVTVIKVSAIIKYSIFLSKH